MRHPICNHFLAAVIILFACIGLPRQFEPMKMLAAEAVPVPREAQQPDSATNDLLRILETQETLLNTVNRLREEAEATAIGGRRQAIWRCNVEVEALRGVAEGLRPRDHDCGHRDVAVSPEEG